MKNIAEAATPAVFNGIEAFREGKVVFHPGGGGEYGWIEIPGLDRPVKKQKKKVTGQKTLGEF